MSVTNATVLELIYFAYDLPQDRVVGELPSWVRSTRFDVQAKAESGPVSQARMRAMTRALLITRFQLHASAEKIVMPVYALVMIRADKTPGPQLYPSKSKCVIDAPFLSSEDAVSDPSDKQEKPTSYPCGFGVGSSGSSLSLVSGRRVTMDAFAIVLSRHGEFGRPVIDRTGLTGEFDLTVSRAIALSGPPELRFMMGLQEQLGLTLRAEEGPVDVLRIHQIEPPSPN